MLLIFVLVPAHAFAASANRRCQTRGMPIAVRTITATGTTCASARTVVRNWFHRLKTPGGHACLWADGSNRPGFCAVRAWRCTSYHTVNGHTYPVVCKAHAGRRRVRFANQV